MSLILNLITRLFVWRDTRNLSCKRDVSRMYYDALDANEQFRAALLYKKYFSMPFRSKWMGD